MNIKNSLVKITVEENILLLFNRFKKVENIPDFSKYSEEVKNLVTLSFYFLEKFREKNLDKIKWN